MLDRIMTQYVEIVRASIQSRLKTRRIMTEYAKIVRVLTLILFPIFYSDFDNCFSS
jgi:hypothetical protein